MKKFIRRLLRTAAFMVCLPLIGTMLMRPERGEWENWEKEEYDTSVTNAQFSVRVDEETGSFFYAPEEFVRLMMYRMVPREIQFSVSEDYIAGAGAAQDPEQEYLKALSIVCRSDIFSAWEAQGCPEVLPYESMRMECVCFYDILTDDTRFAEIRRAAAATKGAVITDEDGVASIPFFTSTPSDLLVAQAGDGAGVSLNFSYELAQQGMGFYEILKYFLGGIKVKIYEQ